MIEPFLLILRSDNIPWPTQEHQFALPRKWRFDYAWVKEKIAIEKEGGVWTHGRHTRGQGFINDLEKYNAAQLLGWRVFRFTPKQFDSGEVNKFILDNLVDLSKGA